MQQLLKFISKAIILIDQGEATSLVLGKHFISQTYITMIPDILWADLEKCSVKMLEPYHLHAQ
jgi:hypothetical protein